MVPMLASCALSAILAVWMFVDRAIVLSTTVCTFHFLKVFVSLYILLYFVNSLFSFHDTAAEKYDKYTLQNFYFIETMHGFSPINYVFFFF